MEQKTKNELLPKLGYYTTLAIVIGAVIGSGIFKKPAVMAEMLGSPELMIGMWIIAGVITLFGALTNAEIAGLLPHTGGQFIYFEKMYGRFSAFLYGWAIFAVMQTGSIASIAYVFGEYSQDFASFNLSQFSASFDQTLALHIPFIGDIYPLRDFGVKLITIGVILFLTAVNYFGVVFGGQVAKVFTTSKLMAIGALVVAAFVFDGGMAENYVRDSPSFTMEARSLFAGIVAAFSAVFWSYDGWNNITYIAGEVIEPQRNIPRALITGMLIIIGVYVLFNLAFLYVIPVEQMALSKTIASDVARIAMGSVGAAFVAGAVMVSTFGTTNGTIMVSARVYYAMSKQKMFFTSIGTAHRRYKTPANALVLQASWTVMLVLSGTFDTLTDMLIFVSWIFYAAGAYGIFVLRKKMPDANRPYKAWGYPFTPIIFVAFASAFVASTLYNDILAYSNGQSEIINSVFGLFLVAIGIPFYLYFNKKHSKST